MDRLKMMESFVSVARVGSYSQAAKQLGLSRALMSRRIIELETRLGVRLFNRNTHRLSLTDAGHSYFTHCQKIILEVDAAEQSLIEGHRIARGPLRILTSQTFGIAHLGAATADFMDKYPEIEVFVMTSYLSHMSMDLVGGGFDLALRTDPISDSNLLMRKITSLKWFIVAAPKYLANHGKPVTPQALGEHRCLVVGNEPVYRWILESNNGTETVKISGIPISNLTSITYDATIAGLGIALLPEYYIAHDLEEGRLVHLFPEYHPKQRWLYAIYSKDHDLPLKTRLFISFLRERFRNRPWTDFHKGNVVT